MEWILMHANNIVITIVYVVLPQVCLLRLPPLTVSTVSPRGLGAGIHRMDGFAAALYVQKVVIALVLPQGKT